MITNFLEALLPPGLEVMAATVRDTDVLMPWVCPASTEWLAFLGILSAMVEARKQQETALIHPEWPPNYSAQPLGQFLK